MPVENLYECKLFMYIYIIQMRIKHKHPQKKTTNIDLSKSRKISILGNPFLNFAGEGRYPLPPLCNSNIDGLPLGLP